MNGHAYPALQPVAEALNALHERADVLEHLADFVEFRHHPLFRRDDRCSRRHDALLDIGPRDRGAPFHVVKEIAGQGTDVAAVAVGIVRGLKLLVVGDQQAVDEVFEEGAQDRSGIRIAENLVFDAVHPDENAAHTSGKTDRRVMRVGQSLRHACRIVCGGFEIAFHLDDRACDAKPAVVKFGDGAQQHEGVGMHLDEDAPFFPLLDQPSGVAQTPVGERMRLIACAAVIALLKELIGRIDTGFGERQGDVPEHILLGRGLKNARGEDAAVQVQKKARVDVPFLPGEWQKESLRKIAKELHRQRSRRIGRVARAYRRLNLSQPLSLVSCRWENNRRTAMSPLFTERQSFRTLSAYSRERSNHFIRLGPCVRDECLTDGLETHHFAKSCLANHDTFKLAFGLKICYFAKNG